MGVNLFPAQFRSGSLLEDVGRALSESSLHSQAKLSAIARQLNERPRKTLLYQTPAEKFAECVAAIG